MMQKAEAQGLSFRSEVTLDGDALKAPIIDSYNSFGEGLYHLVSQPLYRPTYRPPNLAEWAQRKKVDPAQLHASARADDPHVAVPDK
jgi:hypothetical protein